MKTCLMSAPGLLAAALMAILHTGGARADDGAPPACVGRDLAEGVDLKPALARRADDLANGEGLLWRVDRDGLAPSYLYGTMHSSDADAVALANKAARLIAGAKVVATELGALDPVDKAAMAGDMFAQALDRETDTFDGALSAETGQKVDAYLSKKGFPPAFTHHLKLWFLAVMTSLPECETQRAKLKLPIVDEILAAEGKARGLGVVALESAKEQIDIIARLPPDLSATILAQNTRDPDLGNDAFATMLRLYREKRPAEIFAIVDSLPGFTQTDRSAQDRFMQLMLGRNATMAERAAPLLAAGGAFIAVGALHLAGKQGLVERFREAGYGVSKVW